MTIDTLAYTKYLIEKGSFTSEQAESLVEAQRDHVLSELATKENLASVEISLTKEIETVRDEVEAVRGEIEALREETTKEFKTLRGETSKEFKAVRGEIEALREETAKEFKAVRAEIEMTRRELLQVFDAHQRRIDMKLLEMQSNNWKMAFVMAGAIIAGIGVLIKVML